MVTMLSFSISRLRACIAVVLLAMALVAVAGGGPQNVLVVVNANSKESLEIGNAYRRAHDLPYRQLLSLAAPTVAPISYQTYLDEIENPIRVYLKNQQLSDEITCIVLTRGIPETVSLNGVRATASLLAALGLPDKGDGADKIANPYFQAPDAFVHRTPALAGVYLVTVLDGYHNGDIRKLISQGVAADGTAPDGRFILQTSPQSLDQANDLKKMLAVRNLSAEVTTALPTDRTGIMGYFSGGIYSGLSPDFVTGCQFHPGAIADMVQSFGAAPGNFDETAPPLLLPVSAFVKAEITGIHGVVGDAGPDAFPSYRDPAALLGKYTGGFSLAESFYTALPYLNWQNVVIGDPLCAPYAQRPVIETAMDAGPVKGIVPVRVTASSPIPGTTISRIDAYLDGQFKQTVYAPNSALIQLYIGEEVVSYTVPLNATLRTLLEGVADAVNTDPMLTGADGVRAVPDLRSSTVELLARAPGDAGNEIPASIAIASDTPDTPGVMARMDGGWLAGGGEDPLPAAALISCVGRHLATGDLISLQIEQEHLSYSVPSEKTTTAEVAKALVELVNADPALQGSDGVLAKAGEQGMPYLVLLARTPGEQGNTLLFHISVKSSPASQLHIYPDTPSQFSGGHDGSAAVQTIHFMLGETTAKGRYLLDTTELPDGFHRLRFVAYDGSLAQVQGIKDLSLTTGNPAIPPAVTIPDHLAPACGEVTIPLTTQPTVTHVDLFVDGQLLGASDTAPFSITIPLDGLGRGTHDLWAEGVDHQGHRYVTPPTALQVLAPAEVARITPDFTGVAGGTIHRIVGAGFQPNCTVFLAEVPARSVKYISPNLLEVTSDAGPARQGKVKIINADGTVSAPTCAFEYYKPRVAEVAITPVREVLAPGQIVQFTAKCRDQHGFPIEAALTWTATDGTISPAGLYIAGKTPGNYLVRAGHPDSAEVREIPVTVGPAKVIDGRLRHWLALGPFLDPDYTALEQSQIPETTVPPVARRQRGVLELA